MARKANNLKLEQLQQAIVANPGQRPSFFARLFGWHQTDIERRLVSLHDKKVRLYEDDERRLWHCDDQPEK